MDELYEYLKDRISGIYEGAEIIIDTAHAFRLFQLVCYMKHIRGIINSEDEMWNEFRRIKEERA